MNANQAIDAFFKSRQAVKQTGIFAEIARIKSVGNSPANVVCDKSDAAYLVARGVNPANVYLVETGR